MFDFTGAYASTSALIASASGSLFSGLYSLLGTILPLAVGILLFYVGWHWVRRAIGGR